MKIGYRDIVELLANKGANINAKAPNNWTPAYQAAYDGDVSILKFLISKGADLNILSNTGWPILCVAAYQGIVMIYFHSKNKNFKQIEIIANICIQVDFQLFDCY